MAAAAAVVAATESDTPSRTRSCTPRAAAAHGTPSARGARTGAGAAGRTNRGSRWRRSSGTCGGYAAPLSAGGSEKAAAAGTEPGKMRGSGSTPTRTARPRAGTPASTIATGPGPAPGAGSRPQNDDAPPPKDGPPFPRRVASRPWLRMRRGSSAAADPGPEQARAAFPGGKGPRLRPPGWSRPRPGCGSPAPQSQLVPVRHGIDESRGRRPGGAAPRATVRVRVSRRRAAARQLEGSGSDPATHARLHGHGDGLRFSPPRRRVGLHRDSFCRRDSGQGGKSPLGPAREPGPGPGPKRHSGGRAGDFPPVLPVVADAVGTTTATNAVVVVSWSRRRAGSGRQSRGRGRGPEPGEGRRPGSTGRAVAGCGPPGQYLPEMTSDRVPRPSGLGVTVNGACRRVSRLGLLPPAFEPEDARVAGVSL